MSQRLSFSMQWSCIAVAAYLLLFLRVISLSLITSFVSLRRSISVPVTDLGFLMAGLRLVRVVLAELRQSFSFKGILRNEKPPYPFEGSPTP